MGTMEDGLWKTVDRCQTWTKLSVAAPGKDAETNIAFVEIDPTSSDNGGASMRIIVATSGQQGSPGDNVRGQSVYISDDAGLSFKPLAGEPSPVIGGSPDYPGYVGQRATFSGKYLYISYAAYNIGWSSWHSYGCDTGKCYDGALIRYELDANGDVVEAIDITPPNIVEPDFHDPEAPDRKLGYGISGICADTQVPGTLICSSITASPDTIYRSTDYGLTWKPIMSGLAIGNIDFNVSYQQAKYNGNDSLIHWMSDIKINPFNSDMALFNTGAGIFMTMNLTEADQEETVTWSCCNLVMLLAINSSKINFGKSLWRFHLVKGFSLVETEVESLTMGMITKSVENIRMNAIRHHLKGQRISIEKVPFTIIDSRFIPSLSEIMRIDQSGRKDRKSQHPENCRSVRRYRSPTRGNIGCLQVTNPIIYSFRKANRTI